MLTFLLSKILRSTKAWPFASLSASLLVVLAGCRLVSTPLSRILEDPWHFHGREVSVTGKVQSVRWMPQVGVIGFQLTSGDDSLLVLTETTAPDEGEEVRLQGRVLRRFPVDGADRVVLLLPLGSSQGPEPLRPDPR